MKKIFQQHKTEKIIIQSLYAWYYNTSCIKGTKNYTKDNANLIKTRLQYLNVIYYIIVNQNSKINNTISKDISINIIERIILNMAVCKILTLFNIKLKFILNETAVLIKKYGNKKNYKLINKILIKIYAKHSLIKKDHLFNKLIE